MALTRNPDDRLNVMNQDSDKILKEGLKTFTVSFHDEIRYINIKCSGFYLDSHNWFVFYMETIHGEKRTVLTVNANLVRTVINSDEAIIV